ncbi:MAG: hypothetical protein J6Q07_07735 [Alistipes sp.]|nr:hypothetical protein [Alistipes sp.]
MKTRLVELINRVADGNKAQFARMMGWKPQYLNSLLNGRIGLTPIIYILQMFPNLDARWLLLGDGDIFNHSEYIEIRSTRESEYVDLIPSKRYINSEFPQEKDCTHSSELINKSECEKTDLIPVISEANEDILKTPHEKERSLIHTKICSRYKELMKQFPGVKPNRLMNVIATEHSRTIPNIRKILIDYGLYSNKSEVAKSH